MTNSDKAGAAGDNSSTSVHTARTGECIYSIAATFGVPWGEIWDHPSNSELRDRRRDPGHIVPGDRVTVPRRQRAVAQIQVGTANRYRTEVPKTELRLRLEDGNGLYRSKSYTLILENGLERRGQTDSEGGVIEAIPAHARSITLVLHDHPRGEERFTLQVGRLPPADGIPGLVRRLCNMGYPCSHRNGEIGRDVASAVRRFQRAEGMDITGELDQATRDRIVQVHGC